MKRKEIKPFIYFFVPIMSWRQIQRGKNFQVKLIKALKARVVKGTVIHSLKA